MKNDSRGQALVETLLTIVLLTTILFAAIQFSIWTVNIITSNDAAFAASRVAVVALKQNEAGNMKLAALYVLGRHISPENYILLSCSTLPETMLDRRHGQDIVACTARLKYATSVMFGRFLTGSYIHGATRLVKGSSVSRMVKSPDEEFYKKAYPGAKNFNQ